MKTKTKEVYYCEHCKKHGLSKHKMLHHEAICSSNPENNRPCFNCKYLCKKTIEVYIDHYDGSQTERQVDLFFCNKKDVFLYTPKNQIKGNYFDLGDHINEPMPKECEMYSEQDYTGSYCAIEDFSFDL